MDKEKIKAHALEISKELEKANPYIKVEIDSKSVKITETVEVFPFKNFEASENTRWID